MKFPDLISMIIFMSLLLLVQIEENNSINVSNDKTKKNNFLSWIFGESPSESDLQKAEAVYNSLENDMADEFYVEDDSFTNPGSGMLSNIFAVGSNLITRQRRSPDDNSIATSKFRLPLMLSSWFTKEPDVKVAKEAEKVSQSNENFYEITSPPPTNKNNYVSWSKVFGFKNVNTEDTQISEQVKDNAAGKNTDDKMLISVPIKDSNPYVRRNWAYNTKRSMLNEENARKKLNIEDTQTSEPVKNAVTDKNIDDKMLTSVSVKDTNPYVKRNRPYSTKKSTLSEENAHTEMVPAKEQQSNNYYLSPYTIISNMLPPNASKEVMTNLWKVYNNPENQSYLNSAIMFARIMSFFMPGLGIFDQINFSIAMSKIVWKVATMYSQGSSMKDIALTVGPDAATAYLYPRDVAYILKPMQKSEQPVDVSSMNLRKFIDLTSSMQFPPLSNTEEKQLKADLYKLVDQYLPGKSVSEKNSFVNYLIKAVKFFVLFNTK